MCPFCAGMDSYGDNIIDCSVICGQTYYQVLLPYTLVMDFPDKMVTGLLGNYRSLIDG